MIFNLLKFGFFFGILIAFISLGFSLIYNILRIVDFSHTDRLTLAGYLFIIFYNRFGLFLSIITTVLCCVMLSVLTERFVYSPLLKKGITPVIITSFGISIIMQALFSLVFSSALMVSPISEKSIKGLDLFPRELIVFLVLVISIVCMNILINKSRFGKSLRAIVSNRESAILYNLPVRKYQSWIYGISGLFGAIGGISIAIGSGVTPSIGFKYLIFAFSASIVGGIRSLWGVVISGILFGIFLTFAEAFGSSLVAEAFALSLLVLILYFKPSGIFGDKLRTI